jgi:hypothetical protein
LRNFGDAYVMRPRLQTNNRRSAAKASSSPPQEVVMRCHRVIPIAICAALALWAGRVAAHPGSGIAVDDQGNVSFTDTGRGVWRIAKDGKATLISDIAMHWMALDEEGAFADAPAEFGEWFGRITPRGQKPTLLWCSDFPFTVGKDGNVYYAKMHGLTIMRRTPAGEEVAITEPEDFGFDDEHAVGVNGLACGPDGTLYLVMLDDLHQSEASADHWLWSIEPNGKPVSWRRTSSLSEFRPRNGITKRFPSIAVGWPSTMTITSTSPRPAVAAS